MESIDRANAIIEALGKLGVPSSRLKPSFAKVNTGKPPRTEFIARPLEGLMAMGFEPDKVAAAMAPRHSGDASETPFETPARRRA